MAFDRAIAGAATPAFSLIEVVVALGIFAVGLVSMIGLLGSIAGSASVNSHAEAAAWVADAVQGRMREEGLERVATYLMDPEHLMDQDWTPDNKPAADDRVFFASLSGDKVGRRDDPIWEDSAAEFFFEIVLIRNDALSPPGNDAARGWLAYTIRIRWPVFIAAPRGAVQPGVNSPALVSVDHSHRQAFFFSGAVRR